MKQEEEEEEEDSLSTAGVKRDEYMLLQTHIGLLAHSASVLFNWAILPR